MSEFYIVPSVIQVLLLKLEQHLTFDQNIARLKNIPWFLGVATITPGVWTIGYARRVLREGIPSLGSCTESCWLCWESPTSRLAEWRVGKTSSMFGWTLGGARSLRLIEPVGKGEVKFGNSLRIILLVYCTKCCD